MQQAIQHPVINEIRQNISLSIPLIASWLIYAASGFVGTVMVARLGETALAASVVVGGIWVVISVFFYGTFNAVSVLVSHQFGAQNCAAIGSIIRNALIFGAMLCVPAMLVMQYSEYFLALIVPGDKVLVQAVAYAHALLWATPGMVALVIFENLLNGIGKTRLSLWISLCEVPMEIFLIYIFVFGKFGVPAYGVAGVGYGFTMSYTLTTIGVLVYLAYSTYVKPFGLFMAERIFEKRYFHELVRVGMPIGFMYLIEVSAFSTATFLMARFGTVALAAQQIAMQFLGVTVNIPYAMGQAVSIRIGQNAGRLDMAGVRTSAYVGTGLSVLFILIIACIYIFYPLMLLRLDIDIQAPANQSLVRQAAEFLGILGIFELCDSLRVIAVSSLRAMKDTRFPMYISLISFWLIGMAAAFVLAFVLHYDGRGIWFGLMVGVAAGALILFVRMRYILQRVNLRELIEI